MIAKAHPRPFLPLHIKRYGRFLFLLLVASLFSSCASTVYVSCIRDPNSNLSRKNSIAVFVSEDASIAKRKLGAMVEESLARNAVPVKKLQASDYAMTIQTQTDSNTYQGSRAVSTPTTTQGQIGGLEYSQTTTSTTYAPTSYTISTKGLYFNVYSMKSAKMITVWEGSIGCNLEDWESNPNAVLDALFQFYPNNAKGWVKLKNK
jgi:hypothetical protein